MNEQYFKEQAARVRSLADKADPFTKKRLLDLAERYDRKLALRPHLTKMANLPVASSRD